MGGTWGEKEREMCGKISQTINECETGVRREKGKRRLRYATEKSATGYICRRQILKRDATPPTWIHTKVFV